MNQNYSKVLTFSKRLYDLNKLYNFSNEELETIAKQDFTNCKIYTIKEYQALLNSFKPYDNLVWTIFI